MRTDSHLVGILSASPVTCPSTPFRPGLHAESGGFEPRAGRVAGQVRPWTGQCDQDDVVLGCARAVRRPDQSPQMRCADSLLWAICRADAGLLA